VPAAGVKGDIGDILRKAMESDPARQYGSAAQLAEDVERYLAKRPVNAHVNSWGYRAGRFAARHPVAAAVSGLLALTLAGVAAWRR
jgi:serine/threonine-protein kinase